ncbi:MAG: 2-C-methyl-D-erythritol 4-phosphate cytidylyltransferase [Chitinophagaceae bacterium]
MNKYAVIVAGGAGLRMGTSIPKQFLLLKDKPVLWHTVTAFLQAYADVKIILVLPEQHLGTGVSLVQSIGYAGQIKLVAGGETRFHSVQEGLKEAPEDSIVFVHDGVRCLVTTQLIQRCYEGAVNYGNAIPAIFAVDSMRIETASGFAIIDRNKVRIIQTPQTFSGTILKNAFTQEYQASFTDEACVVESYGERIHLIEGEATNIKVTWQMDLLMAGKILEEREMSAQT